MKFTSFHWLGKEVWREVFEADSDEAAREEHAELGPCAYDERRLFRGDVALEQGGTFEVVEPND